ncbi:MAG TPA: hypothetical protein VFK52_02975 [Nocardioidaceae bacterium]|nr:hypothetical protein [Nocardioidaceae bacterium]
MGDLLGRVERLLAVSAAAVAVVYVGLNMLYLEYFDDFGVRPEQVGIDRLAVLGRAAWVVVPVLLVLIVVAMIPTARLTSWFAHRTAVVVLLAAVLVVLVGGGWLLKGLVEDRADRVLAGRAVDGISFVVEIVDVRAYPATVTWLGSGAPPAGLEPDRTYMFVGRGEVVALVDPCDQSTLMLEPDQVALRVYPVDQPDASATAAC